MQFWIKFTNKLNLRGSLGGFAASSTWWRNSKRGFHKTGEFGVYKYRLISYLYICSCICLLIKRSEALEHMIGRCMRPNEAMLGQQTAAQHKLQHPSMMRLNLSGKLQLSSPYHLFYNHSVLAATSVPYWIFFRPLLPLPPQVASFLQAQGNRSLVCRLTAPRLNILCQTSSAVYFHSAFVKQHLSPLFLSLGFWRRH